MQQESFLTGVIIALTIMLIVNYAIGRARNIRLKTTIKNKRILCKYKIIKVEDATKTKITYNVIGDVFSNKTENFDRSFKFTGCLTEEEAKIRALEFFIKLNHDIIILKDEIV